MLKKQRISLNKVLNSVMSGNNNEEILLVDDELSNKALYSTTFIKQLDNKYNNAIDNEDYIKDAIYNKSNIIS